MTDTIRTDLDDGILTVTLDLPDRMNAFTPRMMTELIAACDRADADDAVRAVVVTGAGRVFCAGADLAEGAATFDYAARETGPVDWDNESIRDTGGRLTLRLFALKKPLIGAINGAAVGIGATMILPMDFRIASDAARFGFVFARRGIVPEAASSWFLPRLVGIEQALDWCYSGRVFDAAEALAGGLVREVVTANDLLPAARALAHRITADSAPVSIALTRSMMWRMMGAAHPIEAHRLDSRLVRARGAMADAREGVMSFLDKRPADYTDRVSTDLPHFSPWMDDPAW